MVAQWSQQAQAIVLYLLKQRRAKKAPLCFMYVSEKQKFYRLCLTLFISNNIKMLE
jgi:hypothetical protein